MPASRLATGSRSRCCSRSPPTATTFELPKLTLANAADFYANAPRTSLVIENLNIGGTRPGYGQVPTGGYNMGRNEISGLSFNYLKVTSHNL